MNIAVHITTTPNRYISKTALQAFETLSPDPFNTWLHVDDKNEGIVAQKNKGLALSKDADFVFLFDDDTLPIVENWWKPYVESGLDHAMYIFDRKIIGRTDQYVSYSLPRGCMLFLTRKAIDTAGGFDPKFSLYSYEHPEYSRRIFNMGLTPAPYIDIPNSKGLFYSHDEHGTIQSSVSNKEKYKGITKNRVLFEQSFNSNQFIPYG